MAHDSGPETPRESMAFTSSGVLFLGLDRRQRGVTCRVLIAMLGGWMGGISYVYVHHGKERFVKVTDSFYAAGCVEGELGTCFA